MERELLRSAKWNARNGHLLFHEGNRARLRDMVTFHLPGMAEAPHGKKGGGHPQEQQKNCVRVGFVQCLTEQEGEQVKRRRERRETGPELFLVHFHGGKS